MPRPNNPPPSDEAGALTQPRQLQRWLDVNLIHPLTRTMTYVQLPVFSVDAEWKGYSEIVGVFNYSVDRNFSFKAIQTPEYPNYCLCVMWVDEYYNVYRYKLWENVGEVFYFDAPLYTGQLVKGNFRLEIWSVTPETISELTMFGAGTAAFNRTFIKTAFDEYLSEDGFPVNIELGGGLWIGYNSSGECYQIAEENFPYGTWETTTFGSNPPPTVYTSIICSNASVLTFYTSVRGNFDYRFQDDNSLGSASAIVTDFSVFLDPTEFLLPMIWPPASVPVLN